MDAATRTCATCVLCLRADYGYSNWTVRGTELFCLAGLNPALNGQEEPDYPGELTEEFAGILDVAKACQRYRFGAPATLDVDVDGDCSTADAVIASGYTDDREAAELLVARAA